MTNYLVYRRGSNSANQPRTFEWVPIAIVRAKDRQEAIITSWHGAEPSIHGCPSVAAEIVSSGGNLDVWANQTLKAIPESRAKADDWNSVLEADALNALA